MNWSRGLFRCWLVLSVFWVVLVGAIMHIDREVITLWDAPRLSALNEVVQDGSVSQPSLERASRLGKRIRKFAVVGLGVPAGVLVFGAAMLWAVRGFAARRRAPALYSAS